MRKGTYVDPDAGKVTFRAYAEEWRQARSAVHDASTAERIESVLRIHVYPVIGDYPMRLLSQRPTILKRGSADCAATRTRRARSSATSAKCSTRRWTTG